MDEMTTPDLYFNECYIFMYQLQFVCPVSAVSAVFHFQILKIKTPSISLVLSIVSKKRERTAEAVTTVVQKEMRPRLTRRAKSRRVR